MLKCQKLNVSVKKSTSIHQYSLSSTPSAFCPSQPTLPSAQTPLWCYTNNFLPGPVVTEQWSRSSSPNRKRAVKVTFIDSIRVLLALVEKWRGWNTEVLSIWREREKQAHRKESYICYVLIINPRKPDHERKILGDRHCMTAIADRDVKYSELVLSWQLLSTTDRQELWFLAVPCV